MQQGTGCVRRHDGSERPEPESTLENIYGMRLSKCQRGESVQLFRSGSEQAAAAGQTAGHHDQTGQLLTGGEEEELQKS